MKDDALLTHSQAAKILSVSLSTFRRRVEDGTLPKPIKIASLTRWRRSDILGYIEKAFGDAVR